MSLIVLCMHYIDVLIDINTRVGTKTWYVYIGLQFIIIIPLTYFCSKWPIAQKIFQIKR